MPFVDVSGGRLHYRAEGTDGPWLVLVTGLNGLSSFWDATIAHFSNRFRVLAHDHLGYGQSHADRQDTSLEELTADVLSMMDHAGADRVHLVGHSLGGMISQTIALDHSGRLASLVLSGTSPGSDNPLGRIGGEFRLDVIRKMGLDGFVRLQTLNVVGTAGADMTLDELLAREGRTKASLPSADLLWHRLNAAVTFNRIADLEKLDIPTLVVAAEDDATLPPRQSRQIASLVPGAELHVLPKGGHFFPSTEPASYVAVLEAFYAKHGIVP